MTNFRDAAVVNDMVGNTSTGDWADADHQIGIIRSEFEELEKGIAERNEHEVHDGIADLLFTAYGLAHRMGYDANRDYEAMMVSQWTKFDATEEEAARTREKYTTLGIAVLQRDQTHPFTQARVIVTYSSKAQLDHQGRQIPEGKWLKSYKFQEPVYA